MSRALCGQGEVERFRDVLVVGPDRNVVCRWGYRGSTAWCIFKKRCIEIGVDRSAVVAPRAEGRRHPQRDMIEAMLADEDFRVVFVEQFACAVDAVGRTTRRSSVTQSARPDVITPPYTAAELAQTTRRIPRANAASNSRLVPEQLTRMAMLGNRAASPMT